jgi:predicted acyl esterase
VKIPAILEYLRFRKDGATVSRDRQVGHNLAGRGYNSVRVDVRSTGSSVGVPAENECQLREQLDGCEVIEWLADKGAPATIEDDA